MNGMDIIRGLTVPLKRFFETYLDDILHGKGKYYTSEGVERRRRHDTKGIFAIQYPEEKLPVPEEFRYLPILIYDVDENGDKKIRCTACGICAKACPPQCIWITRKVDPVTSRPISSPEDYAIDVDICMNCGFCAEFCPFDAIKMDHNYEIATLNRNGNIYHLKELLHPASYYAEIRPYNYALEEAAKAEKEAAKLRKVEQGS